MDLMRSRATINWKQPLGTYFIICIDYNSRKHAPLLLNSQTTLVINTTNFESVRKLLGSRKLLYQRRWNCVVSVLCLCLNLKYLKFNMMICEYYHWKSFSFVGIFSSISIKINTACNDCHSFLSPYTSSNQWRAVLKIDPIFVSRYKYRYSKI